MIRGMDNKGNVILGITRREVVGLVEGHRCCFPNDKPQAPGPHICLWFAEDDDALIARLDEMYPDGVPEPVDYRTKREPWSTELRDETLTAEERARLEWEMSDDDDAPDGPSTELVAKLLRLYAAALARAQAAESSTRYANGRLAQWVARAEAAEQEQRTWFGHAQSSLHDKLAAESALAAATALLDNWCAGGRPVEGTGAFLSRTREPAAPTRLPPRKLSEAELDAAPAAEIEPDPDERDDYDKAPSLLGSGGLVSPDQARIAELGSDLALAMKALEVAAELSGPQLQARIARAIAELEKLAPGEYDLTYAQLVNGRARAILKGEA